MQSLFAKQGELNQLNKNKDNLVDMKECITDEIDFDSIALNPNSFSKYIDKDNDGVLNKKDHEFFLPKHNEYVENESKNLFEGADNIW